MHKLPVIILVMWVLLPELPHRRDSGGDRNVGIMVAVAGDIRIYEKQKQGF